MVKLKLTAEGYETAIINTGEGAFELAKQVKPDIAILDIMLPGVTGYEVCRKIRKDPELYRMAILIMTALGEEPEVLHGLEQGGDDYLTKPFKLDQLMDKVAAMAALCEAIEERNPVTNLAGTEAAKREIDLRLVRDMPTAAIYIDIVGLKPYYAARGMEGQHRTLKLMAKTLRDVIRAEEIYENFLAHMGGAHFVVVVNLEDYDRFCKAVMQTFDTDVRELYTAQELKQGHILATDKRGLDIKCPLMALSMGVAHTQFRKYKNAKQVFEVLAQTRQMARPDGLSVLFADRRCTDR